MNAKYIVVWIVGDQHEGQYIDRDFVDEDAAWTLYAKLQEQPTVTHARIIKEEQILLDEYDGR